MAVDDDVETTLQDLVFLDLLTVDVRGRGNASRRQHELHLDRLAGRFGRRAPQDVDAAVRHGETVTRLGHRGSPKVGSATVQRPQVPAQKRNGCSSDPAGCAAASRDKR